jgi:cytochrome b6-f complex iron-sulfur subunit
MSISHDCDGCTRRFLLRGFAIGAGVKLLGCTMSNDATNDTPPDAAMNTSNAITMCDANTACIDLDDPGAAALKDVNGSLVYTISRRNLVTVRKAVDTFVTLSSICTHLGCTVGFNSSQNLLVCPCHGSKFSLTGEVVQSPATDRLKSYVTTFDGQNTVTVKI